MENAEFGYGIPGLTRGKETFSGFWDYGRRNFQNSSVDQLISGLGRTVEHHDNEAREVFLRADICDTWGRMDEGH